MNLKSLQSKIEKSKVLRTIWHITYANALSLAFLLVTFFFYLFFAGMFEDYHDKYDYIQDLFMAIPAATAFSFMLLRTAKKKNLICDEELISDYAKRDYVSIRDDFITVWKREWIYFLFIAIINVITMLLTNLDIMISGKPTITGVFVLYAPMRLFSLVFPFSEIFGIVMATLYVSILYMLLVLFYRKKRYAILEHDFRLVKYQEKVDKANIAKIELSIE